MMTQNSNTSQAINTQENSTQAALNPAQFEAVHTLNGPLLILAGAGSGKTRILTYRIAELIKQGEAMPGEIMAVTFTNKAAREMASRVQNILSPLGIESRDVWVSTFHSSGARILREHGFHLGLQSGFGIYDHSDQMALVKVCLAELNITDKVLAPQAALQRLNQFKNEGLSVSEFKPSPLKFQDRFLKDLYPLYERKLLENNAVDFGDLLLKTYLLFRDFSQVREWYQENISHILVDEYQDTNAVQYQWLKLLTGKKQNICVVGDEDQSIYRWRGADIRNILEFQQDFPSAKIVKLEENYRSTQHIIGAASKVIANNRLRHKKTLFTNNPKGDPIEVHILENDFEEAKFVVSNIRRQIDLSKHAAQDIAVFYRTNAQSRLLEEQLRYQRIHYRVYGGLRFFDRAEIKDVLAYMKVCVNPKDQVSLKRVINNPARGLGRSTLDVVDSHARDQGLSFLEAAGDLVAQGGVLAPGAKKRMNEFLKLYQKLCADAQELSLVDLYQELLEATGYLAKLQKDDSIESLSKQENLREFASALADYESRADYESNQVGATLERFLEEVTLAQDKNDGQDAQGVTLMTLHSSKGLEFPMVYMVGLEEELFPSGRGDEDASDDNIEEERRLCYVGMTRAEKRLMMTSAKVRRVFGRKCLRQPSRFLEELPQHEIKKHDHCPDLYAGSGEFDDFPSFESGRSTSSVFVRKKTPSASFSEEGFGDSNAGHWEGFESSARRGTASAVGAGKQAGKYAEYLGYRVGVKVRHEDFGVGQVIECEGRGDDFKLKVRFENFGAKKFLLRFAHLEILP